jgi:DNA-binding MarR family transcriptional regulator
MANESMQDERDPAAPNRAMSALREVMRAFNVATKKLERRFGLSGSQLEALEILEENPGLSPSDLACRSATDQSTASVVVKRLADSGYVERRQVDGDRRRTAVRLTDEGRAILAKAAPSTSAQLRAAFMRMAPPERASLTQLLERWLSLAGLKRAA